MTKKEEFKTFVRNHPELINFIKNKEVTWQQLYEIYDIYGSDSKAWDKYLKEEPTDTKVGLGELTNLVKSINIDNIQKHINTAQKAISVIQELTSKTPPAAASNLISKTPRPLTKFFGD